MTLLLIDPDIEIKVKGRRFATLNNGEVSVEGCDQQLYVCRCLAQMLQMISHETIRREQKGDKNLDFNGRVKV